MGCAVALLWAGFTSVFLDAGHCTVTGSPWQLGTWLIYFGKGMCGLMVLLTGGKGSHPLSPQ